MLSPLTRSPLTRPSRRRLLPAALLAGCLALPACDTATPSAGGDERASSSSRASATPTVTTTPSQAPLAQLPRGGRSLFPAHFVVAHFGTAGDRRLGILGKGGPDSAAARVQAEADTYDAVTDRKVLPAFDFITTVADSAPGADGDYSSEIDPGEVQRYLDAARKAKMLMVLDFQPGKADPVAQMKRYEKFLLEPDVGVALDPEWVLPQNKRRFDAIGRMDPLTINRASSYLANLTLKNRLPEKLFVLHQFRVAMLPQRERIVDRPGLATIIHADGHGDRQTKREVYAVLAAQPPLGMGIKLFPKHPDIAPQRLKYTDTRLLGPADVLALTPQPDMVSIQ